MELTANSCTTHVIDVVVTNQLIVAKDTYTILIITKKVNIVNVVVDYLVVMPQHFDPVTIHVFDFTITYRVVIAI
ncbi:hypothetical protein D3C85_1783100 [compost metagenome]